MTCNHRDWTALCIYCGEVIADTEYQRNIATGTEVKTVYLPSEINNDDWLRLASSAFEFWDNEADSVYDNEDL